MTSELAVEVAGLEKSYGPAAVAGLVRRDHRGILAIAVWRYRDITA